MAEEQKLCPKCKNPLRLHEYTVALPAHLDERLVYDGRKFTDRQALAVRPYFCPLCRYVELYAD